MTKYPIAMKALFVTSFEDIGKDSPFMGVEEL